MHPLTNSSGKVASSSNVTSSSTGADMKAVQSRVDYLEKDSTAFNKRMGLMIDTIMKLQQRVVDLENNTKE